MKYDVHAEFLSYARSNNYMSNTQKTNETIEVLQGRLQQLNEAISMANITLLEKESSLNEYTMKEQVLNKDLDAQIAKKESLIKILDNSIEKKTENRDNVVSEYADIISQLNAANKLFANTKQLVDEENRKLKLVQEEREILETRSIPVIKDTLDNDIQELKKQELALKSEIAGLKTNRDNLEGEIIIIKSSSEPLREDKQSILNELSYLKGQIEREKLTLLELKHSFNQTKVSLMDDIETLKTYSNDLKTANEQNQKESVLFIEKLTQRENEITKREESLNFQIKELAVNEKRLKLREKALGTGVEIDI